MLGTDIGYSRERLKTEIYRAELLNLNVELILEPSSKFKWYPSYFELVLSINISVNAAKHCILGHRHLHTRILYFVFRTVNSWELDLKDKKPSYTLHFQAFSIYIHYIYLRASDDMIGIFGENPMVAFRRPRDFKDDLGGRVLWLRGWGNAVNHVAEFVNL